MRQLRHLFPVDLVLLVLSFALLVGQTTANQDVFLGAGHYTTLELMEDQTPQDHGLCEAAGQGEAYNFDDDDSVRVAKAFEMEDSDLRLFWTDGAQVDCNFHSRRSLHCWKFYNGDVAAYTKSASPVLAAGHGREEAKCLYFDHRERGGEGAFKREKCNRKSLKVVCVDRCTEPSVFEGFSSDCTKSVKGGRCGLASVRQGVCTYCGWEVDSKEYCGTEYEYTACLDKWYSIRGSDTGSVGEWDNSVMVIKCNGTCSNVDVFVMTKDAENDDYIVAYPGFAYGPNSYYQDYYTARLMDYPQYYAYYNDGAPINMGLSNFYDFDVFFLRVSETRNEKYDKEKMLFKFTEELNSNAISIQCR